MTKSQKAEVFSPVKRRGDVERDFERLMSVHIGYTSDTGMIRKRNGFQVGKTRPLYGKIRP